MKLYKILTASVALGLMSGCTDLDETSYDKVLKDSYGKTPSEIETIVGGAYASLRGVPGTDYNYVTEWIWYAGETSSDEAIIPTRGKDWYDGGRHQEMQMHTWTPANDILKYSWEYLYYGIGNVNAIIHSINQSSLSDNDKKNINAELRGIRAFYYWWLCDFFGNVPIVTDFNDLEPKTNSSRKEVYDFVESELLDIIEILPESGYGKFTKNVGNTLLARLYLNAEVYTGTPQWQKCIDACDRVKNVDLESNYFNNFKVANEGSKENIFVIPYDGGIQTNGNYQIFLSLNYSSGTTSKGTVNGVNGMSVEPGIYSKFDPSDIRRGTMIIGPQFSKTSGKLMVNYTESINDWKNATTDEGVRYWKYPIEETDTKWERENDYVLMRYSEVLLSKAEALMRLGQNELAQPLVAKVRARAGLTTPSSVDMNFLYDELLYEFLWENHRRTDNIRFGKFGTAGIDVASNSKYLEIFPIPKKAMELNSKLKQNPGYN